MRNRSWMLRCLLLVSLTAIPARAQAPSGAEVEELIKHHQTKMQELFKAQASDRNALRQSLQTENDSFTHQMISLALQNENSDAGEAACRWVIEHAPPTSADMAKAEGQYKDYYAGSDKIVNAFMRFGSPDAYSKSTESLLRTILKKNNDAQVKGIACLSLATILQDKSPGQSRRLFQRSINQYGSEKVPSRKATVADVASPRLYELQHLAKGMPAPEIEASDADGKPMRLSDFRGKVVMLDFFGDW